MRIGFRELIFLVVLLAVPVASFIYVFKPRNVEIRRARTEISAKQTKLDQLDAMTEKIDDISLAIERGRESIKLIEEKLPSEENVDDILEQVWQLAEANRLAVKSVKSEKEEQTAQYMELPLKLQIEGPFDGFYQFLLDLEALPRITRIKDMTLEREDELSGPSHKPAGSTKAEFTLSIYYEP